MRRIIRSLLYTLACVGAVSLLAGARGNTAVAATTVSGYISTDTTWTAANSPYSVSGNVIVRSGATLTIEPGVTVNFNADKSLQVDGTLIAKGTSASPITFTTAATGTKWAYILFNDSSIDATYGNSGNYVSGSIMEYCVVEYAGGTSVSDNGAIRLNNAHPCINYCTIQHNSAPGIYAYNISGILRITNSTITDNKGSNGAGVYVSHSSGGATTISGNTIKNNTASSYGYGGGIYIAYGTVTLTNNTISSNTGSSPGGGGACGGGIYTNQSTITLTNNTISSNTASSSGGTWAYGGGIYTFYSTITLTNNTISSNTASSSDGTGAYGGGIYTSSSTMTLTNNTISSNTASSSGGTGAYGGGIYIDNSSTITLTNNTISGNTASSGGGGIYTSSSTTVTLTKNTISGNTAKNAAAVYYSGNAGNDGKDFKYNTITGNKATGGSDSCTIWVGSYPLLNYNNIYGNTATYELWFDKSQGSANLNAKDNWWGSSVETAVQDKIYDGLDSSTKALVDYYPYSTAIRTDTGVTVTTTPTPTPTVTTSPSPTPVVSPTPVTQSDVTAPVGSVSINSGASYTNSTTVTLSLSATDSVGVTGYYLSDSSTIPSASATGWTSVTSTTSYSATVSYSLSSGEGSKTIYAWYKDAAGNVSSTASATITLDTTVPTVTISSPTSSSTYTATSSTISMGGSASDSVSGISSVSWSNNRGGNGTATGNASWTISGVSLSSGDNVITFTARDGAGNSGADTLQVTYGTSSTWTTKASMPEARAWGSVADVSNGIIYVAGGYNGTTDTSSLYAYDPSTNTWSTKASMSQGRYSGCGGVISDQLFVAGGWDTYSRLPHSNLWAYDPPTNSWITKANMPILSGCSAAGVSGGKLYVITPCDGYTGYKNYLHVYDPATNTWTAKTSIPTTRSDLAVGVVNGIIYAIGGSNSSGTPLSTVEAYDPTTNTWSAKTSMSTARSGLAVGVVNGTIYAIGGSNSSGTLSTVEAYFTAVTPTPTDTTAPSGSVSINSGASYTNSSTVTLTLSATDSTGVTGYYLSDSSTTPSASASGWTSVTSTTSYSGSLSYSLSGGEGSKTIYAWYKDAAGNVSSTANATITYDTTVPIVTISSPTSSSTYTSTSSTTSLGGSASDSVSGISSVSWSNNRGGNETATGTASWTVSSISLSSGDNVITVTARDGAGNSGTDTITVTYNAGSAPTVVTGGPTNVTTNSAILTGTVNANGLSTTAWFEYGTAKGTYGNKTTSQTVTGSSYTKVSAAITGLMAVGTRYYYRIVAQNSVGTSYGTEMEFDTQYDVPTPTPTPAGIVFGFVIDEYDNPLKGVTATITGKNSSDSTETDENGYYEFGELSQGDYTLTYEKEGFLAQTQDISLKEGEAKDLGTVTMEQIEKGKISGYVVNIKGDPIESVRLKLKGIKTKVIKAASSDADGFFEFNDLGADTYVIFAKKKGYKKTQQKVVLEEGESTEIEIEMKKTSKRVIELMEDDQE